jgi:prophage antirepressor-like protein
MSTKPGQVHTSIFPPGLVTLYSRIFDDTEIRIVRIDGDPWLVAKDVCDALEIGNPTDAVNRLDDDEATLATIEGRSQRRKVNVINEAGTYRLIFTSRKEAAERFKRWLAHDVLPSIRQTGQ